MGERVDDNVVYIREYLEERSKPDIKAIRKRIADIGLEQLLLESEKNTLLDRLRKANGKATED